MFLKGGVGGHGRVHIIYIHTREAGEKDTKEIQTLLQPETLQS